MKRTKAMNSSAFTTAAKRLSSHQAYWFLRRASTSPVRRAGAVLPQKAKKITNGVELATLFEAETPGFGIAHVLNVLLDPTIKDGPGQVLAPPRQAR